MLKEASSQHPVGNRARLVAGAALAAGALLLSGGATARAEQPYSATMAPGTPPNSSWVDAIKVQPDKAPDCSSLKSIVDSVTRGCTNNDEKAVAIYNFMILTHYHCPYPNEAGGLPSIKEINCYGWSLCGGLHTVESALWRAEGWNWRYVGWSNPGHTTVEAQYDGKWHYLDAFLKFYAWMPNGQGGRTIAGQDDLAANFDGLLNDGFLLDKSRNVVYAKDFQFVMNGDHAIWRAPAFLSCGDELSGIESGIKSRSRGGSPEGWAGLIHSNGSYNTDLFLAPGVSLTNTWEPEPDAFYWNGGKKAPFHSCSGYKDTRNDPAYGLVLEPYINAQPKGLKAARSYGNGTIEFAPDFANDAFMKDFTSVENAKYENKSIAPTDPSKPASVVIELSSPYILSKASGQATGADSIEVSTDNGKTFKPADIKDFSDAVQVKGTGNTKALVKINFKQPLTALNLQATVQNNPGSLPYLSPGKNEVSVSVGNPASLGDNKLVVTYAYQLGSRSKSPEQICDQGRDIANADKSGATWSDTITYVQKSFAAKDLPAKLEIDCPTPTGKYPIYPRMVFLRREIISATSTPLPLPQGAVEAQAAPADQLVELPDPFLVGTEKPEPVKVRPVKTVQIPLTYLEFCTIKGEVADKGILSWPKTAAENGKVINSAVIFGGDLSSLPTKDLAAVRLVVPVLAGHKTAAAKLAAVFLQTPVENGKPCDFKELASVTGSVTLPKQPEATPVYSPAKEFKIDLTQAAKNLVSSGGKCNGIALRMLPDRGVDEGYTVHCQISPTDKACIEYDVYTDEPANAASAK